MTSPTHGSPLVGPADIIPERLTLADTRPDREIFADPATPESFILAHNLLPCGRIGAVISRPGKSSALLGHLLAALHEAGQVGLTVGEAELLPLLAEVALSEEDLQVMFELAADGGCVSSKLMTGICTHPRVHLRTIIDSAWQSPVHVVADIAAATGTLAPAAANWVSRELDRAGLAHERLWYVSAAQYNQISAAGRRWSAWARGNPAKVAFLLTSSFAFTNEDEMFAAGQALLAAPTQCRDRT